ncbi:MAG: cysteine desulfurase [Verrucomicrobia bacterium]|jgi:cysteine desulfurase|nr:cysteine desulfurase [Verrucomicrobiota bacterium]
MIYLDNAATTPPDPAVLETFNRVCEGFWANPHSLHRLGERAEQLLEQARAQVVDMLDGRGYRALFTSGATESNNFALKGVAEQYRERGRHIVSTNSEHPSVERVLQSLESGGFSVTRLPVGSDGAVTADQIQAALTDETILVSTMFVNNESGAVTPIAEIADLLQSHQALYHVDGVQGIGKLPFSLREMPVDLLSLSAHKFFGLKGSGVLVLRERQAIASQVLGGGQEFELRSGTVDVPKAAAFAKALRLAVTDVAEKLKRTRELNRTLRKSFAGMQGVACNSPESASPYILNLFVDGIKPETLLQGLAAEEIYISTVSACSSKKAELSPVILALTGSEQRARNAIRISLSCRTSALDIQRFLEAFRQVVNKLR